MNQINNIPSNILKDKIMEIINPESNYTLKDFEKEYSEFNQINVSNHTIPVKFTNKSNNENPKYETNGSSGFDLRANLESDVIIESGKTAIIPTGLFFELQPNFEIQIRPRSGLAAKYGVTVLNTPGTIDADYRGEIKIILINHGENEFKISNGDRVAQAVIATVLGKSIIDLLQIDEVSNDTSRGTGGFGSTGIN
jgi:dUTP pyrophosphatase